ncbi:tyrosine-type recombinase/integrase [Desulfobacula sp.]|uniref:tyrosine-type recombinase/integrase n=1 Tax=Desulfobacula sp. TaxID=2593537 RepID=UPI0026020DF5|nr:tyrosine-type recombinase/integrase [Desulfobacula sp.]
MSIYFIKQKGWRYDFTRKGIRYTESGFKTKKEARQAEAKEREVLSKPKIQKDTQTIQTDMAFLELVNKRLDYMQAYNSERHYQDHIYLARRWIKQWGKLHCSQVSIEMIEKFLLKRKRKTSGVTANKELRNIRALFNFGLNPKRKWFKDNPTAGIDFFPVEKRIKYVPPKEDVFRVILAADNDTQDYLWTIFHTMGRVSEINRLIWQDISLEERCIILYTRKKKGGHLTPRKVPMTDRLYDVISNRFKNRDKRKPWVFWHRYWSTKISEWVEGPFIDRKGIMNSLCKKAGVKYFRYHALRHCGASLLDNANVPIGSIQRFLGHENRLTTEIYLHSIGNSERDAIALLDMEFETKVSHQSTHQTKKAFC